MGRIDTEAAVCYVVSLVPILALPAPEPIPPCQARKDRIGSILRRLHTERKALGATSGPIALHGPIGTDGASATDVRPNPAQSGRGFVLLGSPGRPVNPTRPEPRITFDRPVPWQPVPIGPDPEAVPEAAPAPVHSRPAIRVPVTGPRGSVTEYGVTVLDRRAGRYLIESPRGDAYEVSEFGADVPTCECPAYRHQAQDVTTPSCKHVRALTACGLLEPVAASAPDVCRPDDASRLMSALPELAPVCGGAPDDSTDHLMSAPVEPDPCFVTVVKHWPSGDIMRRIDFPGSRSPITVTTSPRGMVLSSDGWERMAELEACGLVEAVHHGPSTYGHVSYEWTDNEPVERRCDACAVPTDNVSPDGPTLCDACA
jgi:hypothetical protein